MEATRRPEIVDPEFHPSTGPRVRLREFDPRDHLRLVVNPFLAVLALIGLFRLALAAVEILDTPLPLLLLIPATVSLPYLIQFHCLDCGRTGPFPRWRRHACPAVLARRDEARRPRLPIPSPSAQLVAWGWLLGAAAVLLAVVCLT